MDTNDSPRTNAPTTSPRSLERRRHRSADDLPFKVDRALHGGLTDQLAAGLRQAILSGFYRAGDVLPTLEELAHATGTSMRVPREAIDRLRAEGLVQPRRAVGSIVIDSRHQAWKGHVLFILSDADGSYYANVYAARVQQGLIEAGYLFSRVSVVGREGIANSGALESALAQNVTLGIIFCPRDGRIAKRLEGRGIPYVVIGEQEVGGNLCRGWIRFNRAAAVQGFVDRCRQVGARRILSVEFEGEGGVDIAPALEGTGLELRRECFRAPPGAGRLELIQREVMERFIKGRGWSADVVFFADDFLAMGGLIALLAKQVRIPEDLKVATFANDGFGPVFPIELTRLSMDPVGHAVETIGWLLAILRRDPLPDEPVLKSVYRQGQSL